MHDEFKAIIDRCTLALAHKAILSTICPNSWYSLLVASGEENLKLAYKRTHKTQHPHLQNTLFLGSFLGLIFEHKHEAQREFTNIRPTVNKNNTLSTVSK